MATSKAVWCALGAGLAAGVAIPALAQPVFFSDHQAFTNHMLLNAKVLKGVEDFENADISQGGKVPFPDMLTNGVSRPPVFNDGIHSTNLIMQTNRNPGPFAAQDVPSSDPQALFALGVGAFGSNSKKVGEDLGILAGVHCSIDLIFTTGDKTGVGFELSRFAGFGNAGWIIGVFDTSNALMGSFVINGPVPTNPAKNFFGVYSTTPIGRINIFDPDPLSPDALDDIEMWVPSPGAAAMLLAMVGLGAASRRRPLGF
ncbi:MAG: hypothetical protein HUU18_10240 [Phycisphaerales bacterium]|nr:hypothetical protein [Phycisphaerales bacterium]